MSIISDIKSTFSDINSGANDFVISPYVADFSTNPDTSKYINIYAALENNTQQQNEVSTKPLEQSQFTVDSVQIKPYIITIRGVILPDNYSIYSNVSSLNTFVSNEIDRIRGYCNGTQLFTLFNSFTFGTYAQLKLFGISTATNVDLTIPEVTLTFMQVQSSTAVTYNTTAVTPSVSQPQNQPQIQSGS